MMYMYTKDRSAIFTLQIKRFLLQNLSANFGEHEKSNLTWFIIYTKWNNLIGCYAMQRTVIGPGKSRRCQTWHEGRLSWNENFTAKEELNCKNLQILKKMLDKWSQFLSSEQPSEPKSFDVALNIADVGKNTPGELVTAVNFEAIRFELWTERSVSDGWNCVLCPGSSVVGDSQISFTYCRRHLLVAIQSTVGCSEVYFARCCALKRTGTFAMESEDMCLFYLILRSYVLMFRIPDINQCVKNYFETEKSWIYWMN